MKEVNDFDSPIELRDYVIGLVREVGICEELSVTHPQAFQFFKDLFHRHPEKERKGVLKLREISIRRFLKTPHWKQPLEVSDYQFIIHTTDGTEDSISWNTCAKGEANPIGKKINWAMRYAIKSQIREFKRTRRLVPCELCGTYEKQTVDHIKKFKELKDEFLTLHPTHPKEFAKNEFAQEIFRPEDAPFVEKWQIYHKENATLRILCEPCNRRLDVYGSWWV